MNLSSLSSKISFWAAVVVAMNLLAGCATGEKKHVRVSTEPRKWYESDMDSQDRAFFLGSFINQDH